MTFINFGLFSKGEINMKATNFLYQVVDNNFRVVDAPIAETREQAREVKRVLEKNTQQKYKIVQYVVEKVVR